MYSAVQGAFLSFMTSVHGPEHTKCSNMSKYTGYLHFSKGVGALISHRHKPNLLVIWYCIANLVGHEPFFSGQQQWVKECSSGRHIQDQMVQWYFQTHSVQKIPLHICLQRYSAKTSFPWYSNKALKVRASPLLCESCYLWWQCHCLRLFSRL